jgi:hypothetical protein
MPALTTKIAAARQARRLRRAEQVQALWEERRRYARRSLPTPPLRFAA